MFLKYSGACGKERKQGQTDFLLGKLGVTALSLLPSAAWLSPTTLPLILQRFPLHPCKLSFRSPRSTAVAVFTWMSERPCTAGTEPIKDLDCKLPTEKSQLQTNTQTLSPHCMAAGVSSLYPLVPSLSLGLLLLSQPTPLCSRAVSLISRSHGNQICTSSSQGAQCLSEQLVRGVTAESVQVRRWGQISVRTKSWIRK